MKRTVRNILISLFFYTGVPHLRFLYLRKKCGPLLRVIAFHDIPDQIQFEQMIIFLQKHFNIITPEQFELKDFSDKKINILLTFDDGYKTWVTHALPILQKHDLKAIFFVSSGFINACGVQERVKQYVENNLRLKNIKQPLSWDNLRTLHRAGMSIGGHTVEHKDLALLSSDDALQQIQADRDLILDNLKAGTITYFAYPFGESVHIPKDVSRIMKDVGYHYAFSTIIDFNRKDTDTLLLRRDCVDATMPLHILRAWVFGTYDMRSLWR